MLHKLGFDKENVYEELKAAVRYVILFILVFLIKFCIFLRGIH